MKQEQNRKYQVTKERRQREIGGKDKQGRLGPPSQQESSSDPRKEADQNQKATQWQELGQSPQGAGVL